MRKHAGFMRLQGFFGRGLLLAGMLATFALTGCPKKEAPEKPTYVGDGKVSIPKPEVKGNEVVLKPEQTQIPTNGDPVENTLKKLFESADGKDGSALPKGTRLLSLKVSDKVATLDLSKEFAEVGSLGTTGESTAQKILRQTLAQFPDIEQMTVLVEGKTLETEHAGEWEKIPVKGSTASNDEGGTP